MSKSPNSIDLSLKAKCQISFRHKTKQYELLFFSIKCLHLEANVMILSNRIQIKICNNKSFRFTTYFRKIRWINQFISFDRFLLCRNSTAVILVCTLLDVKAITRIYLDFFLFIYVRMSLQVKGSTEPELKVSARQRSSWLYHENAF